MKHISYIISLAIGFAFYSCTNSEAGDVPVNSKKQSSKQDLKIAATDANNQISFKVDTDHVVTSGWNISRSMMNNQLVLNVTSNMHEEHKTINLNINGDKPGRYKFLSSGAYNKAGYAYGSYFSDNDSELMNPYQFGDGEFTITSIDTVKGILNAEFSAIVKSGKGETLTITDGKISKGKLKLGIVKY
ncbi:MAG: hypothetical protein ABI675_11030 [Chitinophagaceae bacterium]